MAASDSDDDQLPLWPLRPPHAASSAPSDGPEKPDPDLARDLARYLRSALSTFGDLERNWLYPEVHIFAILVAIFGIAAYSLIPSINTPTPLVSGFRILIYVPDLIDGITVEESHPADDQVTLSVSGYTSKDGSPPDDPPYVRFALPDPNVRFVGVEGAISPSSVKCAPDCSEIGYAIDYSGTDPAPLSGAFPKPPLDTSFYFRTELTISGVSGVGFVESNGQVTAQIPLMDFRHPASQDWPIDTVLVKDDIDGANAFNWDSDRPTTVDSASANWVATIDRSKQVGFGGLGEISTGVRKDLEEQNSNHVFFAGVLIGLAGAALIAGLQSVFAGVGRRRESRGLPPATRAPQ